MMNSELISISMTDLSTVSGGQPGAAPVQPPKPPPQQQQQQKKKNDYPEPNGNVVRQGGQMVDNAATGYNAARKAGCSVYESMGNAAIAFFGLPGGFGPDGKPRE